MSRWNYSNLPSNRSIESVSGKSSLSLFSFTDTCTHTIEITGNILHVHMFSSLRGKNQRPLSSSINSQASRATNTTHANTISLSSGNLIVGSTKKFKIESNTLSVGATRNSNQLSPSSISTGFRGKDGATTRINSKDATPIEDNKNKVLELVLIYHEPRRSDELILLNISELNGIRKGDLCELKTYSHRSTSSSPKNKKIYFIAKDFDSEIKMRCKGANISIQSGPLQNLLDLPLKSKVWVKSINSKKSKLRADLIEINIKDCLLNRGDMWGLSNQLINTCVFAGQKLSFLDSIRGTVKGIYRDGKKILSGYINEDTKIIFRSESAKLIFLIQITEEMWHFEESGEQLFQKMVNSFFPKIFKKWKDIDTHHNITIAFAISMDNSEVSFKQLKPGERLSNTTDYYRIVVDEVNIIHWVEIMETLRKEFMHLTKDLLNVKTEKGYTIIKGRFAPVIKSNFLELINFASTVLINPFRQLDLRHTTTHVMIVTPGSGLYDVDYDLLRLTGKKLLSLEMTMDLICLSKAPLHVVPLFRYLDYEGQLHNCIPNWFSIFFWNDIATKKEQWSPRCKIYDLQMMGLTENEISEEQEIVSLKCNRKINSIARFIDDYDDTVFEYNHIYEDNDLLGMPFTSKGVIPRVMKKTVHPKSTFVWKGAKFSNPVIEDVQRTQVLANIYTLSNTEDIVTSDQLGYGEGGLTPVLSRDKNTSLALDSLKGITRKNSVRDFTNKLFNKFLPTRERDNSVKSPPDPLKNDLMFEGKSSSSPPGSLPQKTAIENIPIIKKNLSMFEKDNQHVTSSPVNNSFHDSLTTIPSSKYSVSNDRKLQSMESSKSRVKMEAFKKDKNYFYVPNETWIEIRNPSIPVSSDMASELLPVRWKDVWPKDIEKRYSKWRSFTTPAELPVTISSFPSAEDFEKNFIFRNHSVTLSIDQELYNLTYKDLLKNMIYMRLVMGFQICTGEQIERIERLNDKDVDGSACNIYINEKNISQFKIYMMIDLEIHRIVCGENGTIEVQRYLIKDALNPFDQFPSYFPLVKTRYQNDFREAKIDPVRVTRKSLNWNQIDQTLAGYSDFGSDKSWTGFRSKFVVLPSDISPTAFSAISSGRNETLSPEEIRVEGLRRLIASITKFRWKTEKEKQAQRNRKDEIQPEVMFYTGSLFRFINDQQYSLEQSVLNFKDSIFVKGDKNFNKDIDLWKLATDMQHGPHCIKLVNRTWHWRRHKNCFVGSEMVNWLIQNFADIETRDDAIKYGQHLMDSGLFNHVLSKHSFLDGHYFYQFSPEYTISPPELSKNASDNVMHSEKVHTSEKKFPSDTSDLNNTTLSLVTSTNSHVSNNEESDAAESPQDKDKPNVILSNSVIINADPTGKSYKQETCTVHYDRVHNPEHCFHIRLEWLTTTPKLIDDMVGNWSRLCERYGLKLIEIPWEELCTIPSVNPFHSFVEIPLAIDPWTDPEFDDLVLLTKSKFYYHIHLLKSSGFLLDNRASKFLQDKDIEFNIAYSWGRPQFKYAQYIHSSGAYIAEIRENGDLFLAPNNVYISRVNPANIVGKIHASPKLAYS